MADEGSWRTMTFRQSVVQKIDEAIRQSGMSTSRNSLEMESHVFQKAKTKEEYLGFVARLILHVREMNNKSKEGIDIFGVCEPSMGTTKVEDDYTKKFKELSKYIEPLSEMIAKMGTTGENVVKKGKMKTMLEILLNPNLCVPLKTLLNCEVELEKLGFKRTDENVSAPTDLEIPHVTKNKAFKKHSIPHHIKQPSQHPIHKSQSGIIKRKRANSVLLKQRELQLQILNIKKTRQEELLKIDIIRREQEEQKLKQEQVKTRLLELELNKNL